METIEKTIITISTQVMVPVEQAWHFWTKPEHIMKWNNATDEWHTPAAQNDLQEGGNFSYRMEAKDGSFGFDFTGVYDKLKSNELIEYTITDGRKVVITFESKDNSTIITEAFEAEQMNPVEMQRDGWQLILDNFKRYTEANSGK